MNIDRSNLGTELRLPESTTLDAMSAEQIFDVMNGQDLAAVAAVGTQRAQVAAGIEMIVAAFRQGGRLFYFGAGTSGRLGVLDASECPPTFRSDPGMVQGVIAGGEKAMFVAQEGAEDSGPGGAADVDARGIGARDVVVGIAAGGTTPYVHGALRQAKSRGAKTIFIACVVKTPVEAEVDVAIRPLTGPEVVTGSTRLKAGTATKLILNMLTTGAMVRLGKVYGNLMVDLKATNSKLQDRAARIVSTLTGLDKAAATALLAGAEGHVKAAVVMHRRGVDLAGAKRLLEQAGGFLRGALGE